MKNPYFSLVVLLLWIAASIFFTNPWPLIIASVLVGLLAASRKSGFGNLFFLSLGATLLAMVIRLPDMNMAAIVGQIVPLGTAGYLTAMLVLTAFIQSFIAFGVRKAAG